MTHGIGRSGNIRDPQPKAAGSSIICKLTDALVLDAVRTAGVKIMKEALVLPMATGTGMNMKINMNTLWVNFNLDTLWGNIIGKEVLNSIATRTGMNMKIDMDTLWADFI